MAKISELIELLEKIKKQYGDILYKIQEPMYGELLDIQDVKVNESILEIYIDKHSSKQPHALQIPLPHPRLLSLYRPYDPGRPFG
jgi:hypothetical protein